MEPQCFVYAEILLKLKQTRRSLAIVLLPDTDWPRTMRDSDYWLLGMNILMYSAHSPSVNEMFDLPASGMLLS